MTVISTVKKILKNFYSEQSNEVTCFFFDGYTLRTLTRSDNYVIIRELKFGL